MGLERNGGGEGERLREIRTLILDARDFEIIIRPNVHRFTRPQPRRRALYFRDVINV